MRKSPKTKLFARIKNKLRNKAWFNLSLVLSLWSFFLLISVASIGAVMMYVGQRFGYIAQPIPGVGLFFMLITCIAIGTAEAIFIYRRIASSIAHINKAMGEVSHGNFDVRLDEDYCTEEVRGIAVSFNKMVGQLSANEMCHNDFIANVSHEFKTPLAAVEGYVSLLQDDSLSEDERDDCIRRITETVRRLSDMTGNILLLSRLENQNISPACGRFELDEQIRRAILELEPQWSAKELELDIELDATECVAPQELLYHVWINLIGNAVKYTGQGGSVAVRLSRQGQTVTASISDTGIGMTAEEQSHIFEKFYQADRSHSSAGNGLGLALVKKIASVCGGEVSVVSSPGVGSTFTVTLPCECTFAKEKP